MLILGMIFWLIDLAGVLYLLSVARAHWGIRWHGMRTIVWMSSTLSAIMLGSALLEIFGWVRLAALLAASPAIAAAGCVAVVLGIYAFAGGRV